MTTFQAFVFFIYFVGAIPIGAALATLLADPIPNRVPFVAGLLITLFWPIALPVCITFALYNDQIGDP